MSQKKDQLRPDEPSRKKTSKHKSEHVTKHQIEQFQENLKKKKTSQQRDQLRPGETKTINCNFTLNITHLRLF